jgi:hypothetical protein
MKKLEPQQLRYLAQLASQPPNPLGKLEVEPNSLRASVEKIWRTADTKREY